MSDEDARQDERDDARREAAGQTHRVTIQVTVKCEVNLPGPDHTEDDLDDYVQHVLDAGDVMEVEEV